MSDEPRPSEPLPRIRGTQVGLRDPALVDVLKADMIEGRYTFDEPRGRVGGYRDNTGTLHIAEGHHRMVAALEILRETSDDTFVRLLIQHGLWDKVDRPPSKSRPMPSRTFWGKLRNRLGY
jgi:hypothetical protein